MRRILSKFGVNPDTVIDILGVLAISGMFILFFWLAYGFGLPTGGDQLMGVV